jgi:hypothetical protein
MLEMISNDNATIAKQLEETVSFLDFLSYANLPKIPMPIEKLAAHSRIM